jgi:RNA polymerase sigma-70 factor (ECF subfamily)
MMRKSMKDGELTLLLEAAASGDRLAFDRLYKGVYAELRRMAQSSMRRESPGHTLQPTALVNEAYLRIAPESSWKNRAQFFGAASLAMRRILVDYARRRLTDKRGGEVDRVTLTPEIDVAADTPVIDVLLLDDALTQLSAERPRLAELVSLRFFAGMNIEDAAAALDISPATAKRDWVFARAWLQDRIEAQRPT